MIVVYFFWEHGVSLLNSVIYSASELVLWKTDFCFEPGFPPGCLDYSGWDHKLCLHLKKKILVPTRIYLTAANRKPFILPALVSAPSNLSDSGRTGRFGKSKQ